MSKKEDKVYKVLCHIEQMLEQQNSKRRIFTQGLVRGLGTALGATVLLAIITSLAIQLSNVFDFHMIAEYFFNEAIVD